MMRTTPIQRALMLVGLCWVITGCSQAPFELVPVSGSVKFADGSVPTGEVRVVRFEPVANSDGYIPPRAAAAYLEPDGSFQLMTMRPRDGAIPGDYKIALLFWTSAATRQMTIPKAYGKSATTPFATVSVKSGDDNHFDFIVEK